MQRYAFAVLDKPYCVWEYDIAERNSRFLAQIDGSYFGYLATIHAERLGTDNDQHAAIALRMAYHHAVETLFTLLGAALQAPHCVPAWIPRCHTDHLRQLVQRLGNGMPILTHSGRKSISWTILSSWVHAHASWENDSDRLTPGRFASTWARFASDYLNPYHIDEYNSMKHGMRVRSGGFGLRIGLEHTIGSPPPAEEMQTLENSNYGSSFYVPEPLDGGEHFRTDPHFRIRDRSLNWSARTAAETLLLLSSSINNVASAIKIFCGAKPGTQKFERPVEPEMFDLPWADNINVTSMSMDSIVPENEISRLTAAELVREIEAKGTTS